MDGCRDGAELGTLSSVVTEDCECKSSYVVLQHCDGMDDGRMHPDKCNWLCLLALANPLPLGKLIVVGMNINSLKLTNE